MIRWQHGYFRHDGWAQDARDFLAAFCTHTKGEWAGQPLELEEWQYRDIIAPIFGERRKCGPNCRGVDCAGGRDAHPRRYKTAYIEIPRKMGKSTIAAGVAILLLHHDNEPGAEIYGAAGDKDQAALVFEPAKAMVEKSPELSAITEVYRRSLVAPRTGAFYRIISADAPTKHGFNAHGVIFDEVHVQRNRELYDVLHTSTGARRQPLEFLITTAGYDRKSICWELHEHAVKVRDGILEDPGFLAVIYAAEEGDDWTSPETWKKANPNLGVSVPIEYLATECRRAQETPSYENTFRRLHLNQWTEQDVRWIQMAAWDECAAPVERKGTPVAGIDLASVSDICALSLFWPETCSMEFFCFVPEEGIAKRERESRVPYRQWARDGHLIATEGARTDYGFVRKKLRELREETGLQHLFFDRWNSSHLINEMTEDGFICVEVAPSMSQISAPAKELEAMIAERELRHAGHPVARWCASNVVVRTDADGNCRPDKEKSGDKIDCITAGVLAILGSKSVRPTTSVYEEREMVAL